VAKKSRRSRGISSAAPKRRGELAGLTGRRGLRLSVITSSAGDMPIRELLVELWLLRTYAIDVYPRGCDVREVLSGQSWEDIERHDISSRFSDPVFVAKFGEYVRREMREAAKIIHREFGVSVTPGLFKVPAIATYFPEISSFIPDVAKKAGHALVGAVRLASQLKARTVEFVLGRCAERCREPPIGMEETNLLCEYVFEEDAQQRIPAVVDVLREVVVPEAKARGIRLAAEIEPGYSYILNSSENVQGFLAALKKAGIDDVVGLNLDIGHLLILNQMPGCNMSPDVACGWVNHIFHAHVSDNAGFHFSDLVPGTYHLLLDQEGDPDEDDSEDELPVSDELPVFEKWVRLCYDLGQEGRLHGSARDRSPRERAGRSFSGYIAVEMEGCSRFQWVQRSLLRMGYMIRHVARQAALVPRP
jgi:sugar phosphate isomerase/epimerase